MQINFSGGDFQLILVTVYIEIKMSAITGRTILERVGSMAHIFSLYEVHKRAVKGCLRAVLRDGVRTAIYQNQLEEISFI